MNKVIDVIHVDDDPEFLDLTAEYFELADVPLSVHHETNPEKALHRLSFHDIDCIVSDYDMPEMDGLELLERVREDYPTLPFVLFTGKGSEEVASEAVRLDVTAYQQKTTSHDKIQFLSNTIEKAVSGDRARSMAASNERQLVRYKQAVEYSDDLIVAVDRDLTYLFVNEAFLTFHGLDRDEVEGTLVESILDVETINEIEPLLDRVFEGERIQFVSSRRSAGGDKRYFNIQYYPLRTPTDSIEGLVCEMSDVTDIHEHGLLDEEKRSFSID